MHVAGRVETRHQCIGQRFMAINRGDRVGRNGDLMVLGREPDVRLRASIEMPKQAGRSIRVVTRWEMHRSALPYPRGSPTPDAERRVSCVEGRLVAERRELRRDAVQHAWPGI